MKTERQADGAFTSVTVLQLLQLQLGLCDKKTGRSEKRDVYIIIIYNIYIIYYILYILYILLLSLFSFQALGVLSIWLTVTVTTVTP